MSRSMVDIAYPVSGMSVAYTGTAGTTSAVGAQTRQVYVWTSSDAHIAFGKTATTDDFPMKANVPVRLRINPGQTVSAIQMASGGNLYVGEMSG